MAKGTCSVVENGVQCEGPVYGRGYCNRHYQRWRKRGAPDAPILTTRHLTPIERLLRKVDKDGPIPDHRPDLGPCWIWTGTTNREYGAISVGTTMLYTHRVAYELLVGPIPEGLELDHLCRNHPCCNPSHLEPVTHDENMRRARKTHCKRGHELTPENTLPDQDGCRLCRRNYAREYRRERRRAVKAHLTSKPEPYGSDIYSVA